MKTVSPFLELEEQPRVRVYFDNRPLDLAHGTNLAAALLGAGITVFRETPVSAAPRGPFCMMGACFDCLVQIDGVVRQACMMEVKEGLRILRAGSETANDDPV